MALTRDWQCHPAAFCEPCFHRPRLEHWCWHCLNCLPLRFPGYLSFSSPRTQFPLGKDQENQWCQNSFHCQGPRDPVIFCYPCRLLRPVPHVLFRARLSRSWWPLLSNLIWVIYYPASSYSSKLGHHLLNSRKILLLIYLLVKLGQQLSLFNKFKQTLSPQSWCRHFVQTKLKSKYE